jgi:hypothetical protein
MMPYTKLMTEAKRLKDLSERLDRLADEHPSVTEALIPISAGILRMAIVLEVLVMSRSSGPAT